MSNSEQMRSFRAYCSNYTVYSLYVINLGQIHWGNLQEFYEIYLGENSISYNLKIISLENIIYIIDCNGR